MIYFLNSVRIIPGFFFRRWPKNSRRKKLKEKAAKTQEIFAPKLKKTASFWEILGKNSKKGPKIAFSDLISGKFAETQRIFQNSSPNFVENSRNRQIQKSYVTQKTPKKNPGLTLQVMDVFHWMCLLTYLRIDEFEYSWSYLLLSMLQLGF